MIYFPDTVPTIDAIRGAIGRAVTLTVLDGTTPCPVCQEDPVTHTSINSYCPVCSGVYHMPNYEYVVVTGHVTWKSADDMTWYSTGQLMGGDCRVQVKKTPEMDYIIDKIHRARVDGRVLELDKIIPRGVPQLNRYILILKEEEKDE